MHATVSHFELPTIDVEALAGFYREVFGWEALPLAGSEAPYARLRPPRGPDLGIRGGITAQVDLVGHEALMVIHVDGVALEAMLGKIEAAGGVVEVPPTQVGNWGKFARFRDPAGHRLGLWQHRVSD